MPSMQWQPHSVSGCNQQMDLDQALLQCVKDQAQSLKYIPFPEATTVPSKRSRNNGNLALIWNISLKSPELRTHREIELLTTYLSKSRLLARADMGTLRMAASRIKGIKHLSGSQIIKEGTEQGSQAGFRMLIEGQLGVYKTLPESGALTLVASTGPESGIGAELALNSAQNPCNATVVCQTTCLILEVKGEEQFNYSIVRAANTAAVKVMRDLDHCHVLSGVPRRPDGTIDLIYNVDLVRFKRHEGLPLIGQQGRGSSGGATPAVSPQAPLYLIQSGTVAVFAEAGSNKHQWNHENDRVATNNCQLVAALGPRGLIGEWGLLQQDYNGGRRLHAVAFTVLNAYRITKPDLMRHLVLEPARAESIANVWLDRFLSAGVEIMDSASHAAAGGLGEEDLVISCSGNTCAVSSTHRSSTPTGRPSDNALSGGRISQTQLPPMGSLPERFMELAGAASAPSALQGPPPDRRMSSTDALLSSDAEPLTAGQLSPGSGGGCSPREQRQSEQTANRRLLASYPQPGLQRGIKQQLGTFIPMYGPQLARMSESSSTLPDLQRSKSKPWEAGRIMRGGAQLRRITAPQRHQIPRSSSKRIFAAEPQQRTDPGTVEKGPAMAARSLFPTPATAPGEVVAAPACGTNHDKKDGADGGPGEATAVVVVVAPTPPAPSKARSSIGSEFQQQTNKRQPRENKTAPRASGPAAAPRLGVPLRLGGQCDQQVGVNNSAASVGKLRKKMDYYIRSLM